MPTSAAGFPRKADGDFTTIVYVKNETDQPRKYIAYLKYGGGTYSLQGVGHLAASDHRYRF